MNALSPIPNKECDKFSYELSKFLNSEIWCIVILSDIPTGFIEAENELGLISASLPKMKQFFNTS